MKHLLIAACFVVMIVMGVGELKGEGFSYTMAYQKITSEKPAEAVQAPQFVRGLTTKQDQPCRNTLSDEQYKSDILSVEELKYDLSLAGFTPEQANMMQAIAKAESGHQLNCFGDENLIDSKWNVSYGVYQIRTLKADTGKGTCRDIQRLWLNILEQSRCAYEISNQGTNFRPWSMYLNGRYKQWL